MMQDGKFSWTELKTNEKVLQKMGEERSLKVTIRRQRKRTGHILRRLPPDNFSWREE